MTPPEYVEARAVLLDALAALGPHREAVVLANELAAGVTRKAVDALRELGTDPDQLVPSLAARAEAGFEDPDVIRASTVALVEEVLDSPGPGEVTDGQAAALLR